VSSPSTEHGHEDLIREVDEAKVTVVAASNTAAASMVAIWDVSYYASSARCRDENGPNKFWSFLNRIPFFRPFLKWLDFFKKSDRK
jgi:hypothetical protein